MQLSWSILLLNKTCQSSTFINRKCFSCFNKYKIVGKGRVKCTKV